MLQFVLACTACFGHLTLRPLQDEHGGPNQNTHLDETHIRPYANEKIPSFRLVSRLLGRRSHTTLTSAHILDPNSRLAREVSEIGQFAEVSLGLYDCEWIWGSFEREKGKQERRMEWLMGEYGPLEGYDALKDSELLEVIRGNVAEFQVIITRRIIDEVDEEDLTRSGDEP